MKSFSAICVVIFLTLLPDLLFTQQKVMSDGEELYYEVFYAYINIGWVKFYTERVTGKSNYYITYAKLKSNEAIPFVKVDYEFRSEFEISDNAPKPYKFISYEYSDGKKSMLEYTFRYDSGYVSVIKKGFDGKTEIDKKLYSSVVYQDGLSIFYLARLGSFSNSSRYVPVLMHSDSSGMRINFTTARKKISISEWDDAVSSVYIDGFAYFTAVFGLTGEFEGWFSNDEARVPLKARLKVNIGNISLELKSWKRNNWNPPSY